MHRRPRFRRPVEFAGSGTGDVDDQNDFEGALLDDGRMFAVITVGSSTCVPQVDQVAAEGQTVTVTLVDPEGESPKPCTKDLAPRASLGALPEGVDPKSDITLNVTYGDLTDDVDIDGDPAATGTPGSTTEFSRPPLGSTTTASCCSPGDRRAACRRSSLSRGRGKHRNRVLRDRREPGLHHGHGTPERPCSRSGRTRLTTTAPSR